MSSVSISLINYITSKYIYCASIFIFIAGLIGNPCLILIFTTLRIFRRNQCAFFLTVESVANIGLLLSTVLPIVFSSTVGVDPTRSSLIWCKLKNAFSQIFGLGSWFTICFLSFDQFMSTNPRPNWRQISTLKLARRLTFFNICFVILQSIPFFIYAEINSVEGCTVSSTTLQTYLKFFYLPVLSYTLPVTVTITFSLLAYRNVRRIVQHRIALIRRRLDRQLTAMVLARVICTMLLDSPYVINSMYQLIHSIPADNQLETAITYLTDAIILSLLFLNYAVS